MIEIIAGTNRPGSNTLKAAQFIAQLYKKNGIGDVQVLSLTELPPEIFNPASYAEKPASFQAIQQRILDAEGLHIVTPEYNGSMPGVLKYFIDMLKFPESFEERPVCFTGVSAGMWGAIRPIEMLQLIFGYRNAFRYPHRVFMPGIGNLIDADGNITDADIVKRLEDQARGFADFCKKLKS